MVHSNRESKSVKGSKQAFERFCQSKGWHPDAWWDMWLVWQAALRWQHSDRIPSERPSGGEKRRRSGSKSGNAAIASDTRPSLGSSVPTPEGPKP